MWNKQDLGVAKSRPADETLIVTLVFLIFTLNVITIGCGSAGAGSSGQTSAAQLKLSIPQGQGTVGIAYSEVPSVSGGFGPYNFSITQGSLPPGLKLNSSTGSITGTPTVAGTFNFTLNVSEISLQANATTPVPGLSNFVAPISLSSSGSGRIVVAASTSGTVVTVLPASANVPSQAQQRFTASISGSSNTGVTWSASAGIISSSGEFTAPKVSSNTAVIITATSLANPLAQSSATATVSPAAALAITNSALGVASAGLPYSAELSATGGTSPYQWSISSGALPSGIQLQTSSGVITGITSSLGSYSFVAMVGDSAGHSATQATTLTVSSASASGFDGPAELPRVYIQTAMANTPAPGTVTNVNAGGDLQSALDVANCGDTIQLQAGATFTGSFTSLDYCPNKCGGFCAARRRQPAHALLRGSVFLARASRVELHLDQKCYRQTCNGRWRKRAGRLCDRREPLPPGWSRNHAPGRDRAGLCPGVHAIERRGQQSYFRSGLDSRYGCGRHHASRRSGKQHLSVGHRLVFE